MNFKIKFASWASVACIAVPGAAAAKDYNPRGVYANPEAESIATWKRLGPCADPWVTMALNVVHGTADRAKCNAALYNGGRWSDFNDLVHAVGRKQATISGSASASRPTIDLSRIKYQCSTPNICAIFSNDGNKVGLLSNGKFQPEVPATMVAAGGGNLVGNDGASLITDNGAGLVAAGAGNLIAQKVNMNPPASPMGGYSLQGVNDFRALAEKTRRR